uniref:Leucine-rich repeat protein n=2 Tax=Caenorhabditis tropicalis TaxID=1561998 RepID=A0A1I7UMS7_9PELO
MPNLLATASQVANSLSNLKAKYIKYLETLCSANGIDISTLKTEGDTHKILEMYFGGLPVLVGLKYFSHLSTLRLFGQQITCLKPLGEVAPTLEELWVCEGSVKDLAGIDHCIRLKKLYLYENSIEDATCLSSLTNLQYLSLASNKLKSLTFLCDLKDLTSLSLADNKMKDSVISTAVWPENIQHLDVSANCFSSNRVLFPITMLSSLRSLNIDPITTQSNLAPNLFFAWIAHSFRFIESIDDDPITESFVSTFRPMVDTIFAEKLAKMAKADEKYYKDLRMVEKHSGKIENRLACLAEALTVYKDSMQTKDAKKEIVKRVHEICVNNSKAVKNIKSKKLNEKRIRKEDSENYILLSEFIRMLSIYRISCDMESCQTFQLRDGTTEEIAFITQILNYSCSMKNSYEIIVKSCSIVGNVTKNETERLFILEKDSTEKLFDLRTIFNLLDRFTRKDYTKHSVRLARDFEVIKKQAKEKTTIFFIPLVLSKMATARGASKFIDEDGISSSNDNLSWSDISLVAVLAVEIQPIGQLTTDQLRYMDQFEESYNEQLKKLNEMNIKLDVKEERHKRHEETTETSIEAVSNQSSKIRKVSDVLANISNLTGRACDEKLPFDWFTIRNPLEVALAYFDFKPIKEINDMMVSETVSTISNIQ